MKKIYLLVFFMVIFMFKGTSQVGVGTYSYDLIENDPENVENFNIGLFPLCPSELGMNIHVSAGLSFDYLFKNRLELSGDLFKGYYQDYKGFNDMQDEFMKPADKVKEPFGYDLTASFMLLKKTGEVSYVIKKNSFIGFNHKNKLFRTNEKRKVLHLLGLRVGLMSQKQVVGGTGFNDGNEGLKGYRSDSTKTPSDITVEDFAYIYKNTNLILGLSYTLIKSLAVNLESIGEVKNAVKMEVYFDFLHPLVLQYGDVLHTENMDNNTGLFTSLVRYNINGFSKKTNGGFRLGFLIYDLSHKVGFSYGFESAFCPGPESIIDNYYVSLKLGVQIGTKL